MSGPRPGIRRPRADDPLVATEADAIVAALRERGPLGARELRAAVEARHWGPGRFGPALHAAVRAGRVRRVGRRRYETV